MSQMVVQIGSVGRDCTGGCGLPGQGERRSTAPRQLGVGEMPRFAGPRQGSAAGIIVHPANVPSFNCFSPSPTSILPLRTHLTNGGVADTNSAARVQSFPIRGARFSSPDPVFPPGVKRRHSILPRRSARFPATSRATGSIQSTGPLPQTFPANQRKGARLLAPIPGSILPGHLRERENRRPAQRHWLLPKPSTIHPARRCAAAMVLSRRTWCIGDLGTGVSLSASALRRIHPLCHATEAEGDRGRNTQQPKQRSARPT